MTRAAVQVHPAHDQGEKVRAVPSDVGNAYGLLSILAEAAGEWLKVQSELGASSLAELLSLQVPLYSPEGVMDVYWRTPIFVRNQFTHVSKAMADSFAIWSRTQQRVSEMELVLSTNGTRQWLSAMNLSNSPLVNRRKTAQVIHFSDRRRA
ncbi:MAG: hypothetical protein V4858_06015 [Pseudomonadota bacterium]